MRLFRRKENRALTAADPAQRELDSSVVDLFSDEETVTREQTLQIPTVQACINKISETVSMLPVRLMRKADGKTEEILTDKRVKLLNGDTGDTLNTVEFWKALINDYYVGTGGWAYINTDALGSVESLHYVDCRNVSVNCNEDPIFKAYEVLVNANLYYDFKFLTFLRKTKDGYTNIPIQEECSKVISAAFNALKLEIRVNRSSGCKGGFLKSKNKLSKEVIEDIRRGYEHLYDSMNQGKNRKILVLNDGMEFQEISATPAEMQLNEIKKANAIEICKIFGFPHTIIDGGASEEDRKQFISAVTAVLNQIETELDNKLLFEEEKESGYYFAFDTKELTRGSQKERYEAYQIGLKNRFLQVDEVRKEEDYEPMGFNFVSLGLGDVLLNPQTNEIYTPNTNKLTKINSGEGADNGEIVSQEQRGFNPNQPREPNGRFASTGGGAGGSSNKKLIDKSGESGIIKSEGVFFKEGDDPMYDAFGRADESNPKELEALLSELSEMGVEINYNAEGGAIAYQSVRLGEPGIISVNPNASFSAYLHEAQHAKDDLAAGWNGCIAIWDTNEHIRREKRAYQVEIDLAIKLGRTDIAEKLEKNLNDEIKSIKKRDEHYEREFRKN